VDELEAGLALQGVLQDIGAVTEIQPTPFDSRRVDLIATLPSGEQIPLEVKVTAAGDSPAAKRWAMSREPGATRVLVADRLSFDLRTELTAAGASWFDRRGHLHLVAPGLLVDRDVPPSPRHVERRADGIRGRAGLAYAVACLLSSGEPPTIRGVARQAGLSAPSVSVAAASLRRASLVGSDGRPLLPDLFWAVAERWKPTYVHLGGNLASDLARSAGDLGVFGSPEESGWALTGTAAALGYGAPVVAPTTIAPSFYVPDARAVALASRALGVVGASERSCSIAVAPSPAACVPRVELQDSRADQFARFLATRPLFVALELANDPARGREILADWTPADGSRVW
jgi:hypothetical protein